MNVQNKLNLLTIFCQRQPILKNNIIQKSVCMHTYTYAYIHYTLYTHACVLSRFTCII